MSDLVVTEVSTVGDAGTAIEVIHKRFLKENGDIPFILPNTYFNHPSLRNPVKTKLLFAFYQCAFKKVPFDGNTLTVPFKRCFFDNCAMKNYDAEGSLFSASVFEKTRFEYDSFRKTEFALTSFGACKFKKTVFSDCVFFGCLFDDTDFNKVTFQNCSFENVTFRTPLKATMAFDDCKFINTDFEMEEEIFRGIQFSNCEGV